MLVLGGMSAGFAWAIGWPGWAIYLTAGNVVVNLYPVLLQRYTRARISAALGRQQRMGELIVDGCRITSPTRGIGAGMT